MILSEALLPLLKDMFYTHTHSKSPHIARPI
jgi:hypothetical protein